MKIMIVSDAWEPQVNGVVTTLRHTVEELQRRGHIVTVLGPEAFSCVPLPFYPEIRVPVSTRALSRHIEAFAPDAIHIAVEGRLGIAARAYCLRHGLPFTTAYHTDFPRYLKAHFGISPRLSWRFIRWFHRPSSAVLVSTETIRQELHQHGVVQTREWTRGVSGDFTPMDRDRGNVPYRFLYVGRVSREKNIEAFLSMEIDVPHTKHVVGEGPCLDRLRRAAGPGVTFHGKLQGQPLADAYRAADVFVFPSLSDTFGLVMIEAMACGTPVAAYPVQGPVDVVTVGGCLAADLSAAAMCALTIPTADALKNALPYTWERATDQFLAALHPVHR